MEQGCGQGVPLTLQRPLHRMRGPGCPLCPPPVLVPAWLPLQGWQGHRAVGDSATPGGSGCDAPFARLPPQSREGPRSTGHSQEAGQARDGLGPHCDRGHPVRRWLGERLCTQGLHVSGGSVTLSLHGLLKEPAAALTVSLAHGWGSQP